MESDSVSSRIFQTFWRKKAVKNDGIKTLFTGFIGFRRAQCPGKYRCFVQMAVQTEAQVSAVLIAVGNEVRASDAVGEQLLDPKA